MDARPHLAMLAHLFQELTFEAILIGNAGAAIQGAPITTIDVDFIFRPTAANLKKLKKIAKELQAVIYRPFYPAAGVYRLSREADLLQIDFLVKASGIRSFEGLKSRAERVNFDGSVLLVASIEDIIKSKKAAGRPRDLAVMYVLEEAASRKTRQRKENSGSSPQGK